MSTENRDNNRDTEYEVIRTYSSVWKIPRKIYSIDSIRLPFPVDTEQALYFIVSIVVTIILVKLLPFLGNLPFVIKYGFIPYGLMKFFTKQKLDGKLPHKFFIDYIIYQLSPRKVCRFQTVKTYGKVKLVTPIGLRDIEILDRTEEALKNKAIFCTKVVE